MKAEKIIRFRFSAQTFPQLVQQPQQFCVLLLGQQSGHIVVGLVEAEHRLLVEADALFGEHQLLEPRVLRNTAPLDIPLALHQL